MQHIKPSIIICICILFFAINASAQTDTTIASNDTTLAHKDSTHSYIDSMRGQRYCEVVLVKVSIPNVNVQVYNTFGVNACPEEQLKSINTDELQKQFRVTTVVANGPRYYLMDKVSMINNDTTVTTFDSLQAKFLFKMRLSMGAALSMKKGTPYKERPFKLSTAKVYNKGSVVFEIISPEHTYIMESYSAEVDTTLTLDSLATLGARLKLPDGWAYKTVTLEEDLQLITDAAKEAFGIEDELANRYQRVD
jgi:hypothetical protein